MIIVRGLAIQLINVSRYMDIPIELKIEEGGHQPSQNTKAYNTWTEGDQPEGIHEV